MKIQRVRWAGSNAVATRRSVKSVPDCCSGTITFSTGAHSITVAGSVLAVVASHLDDNCKSSCSQYPGDGAELDVVTQVVRIAQLQYAGAVPARGFPTQNFTVQFPVQEDSASYQVGAERFPIRRSRLKGSSPMEASTSRSGEIILIIVVVGNNMSRLEFDMFADIPPGVRWGDLVQ